MLLAQLAVVFVGLTGDHSDAVQRQVVPLIRAAHVQRVLVSDDDLHALTRNSVASRNVVKGLDADGVVAGEVVTTKGKSSLRFVIYGHTGTLRSLAETPLVGGKLTREDLDIFTTNLDSELTDLVKLHQGGAAPAPVAPVARVARATPPAPRATATAPVSADDDDSPFDAAKPRAAAPVATASVSHNDTDEPAGGATSVTSAAVPRTRDLKIRAAVGIGLADRGFASGTSKVTGYSTSPVGQARFEAGLSPTRHTTLDAVAEHTLTMNTPLADGMSKTTMSRWEVTGGIVLHGPIEVTPVFGIGNRAFAIQSTDPLRSPDNDYRYLVAGMRFAVALGSRVTLRANAAYEPVIGGTVPTDMSYSRRWAFAVGGALDVRPTNHVFARLAVDYQQFAWSWVDAGLGVGGVLDRYPSGLVSLGAEY